MKCRLCRTAATHFLCQQCQDRYLAVKQDTSTQLELQRQQLQQQWDGLAQTKAEHTQRVLEANRREVLGRNINEIKARVKRKEEELKERERRNVKLREMVAAGRLRQKHWQEEHNNISKSNYQGKEKLQKKQKEILQQVRKIESGLEYRFRILLAFVGQQKGKVSKKEQLKIMNFMSSTYLIELPYQVSHNPTSPQEDNILQKQIQANIMYLFSRMNVQCNPTAITTQALQQFHTNFISRLKNKLAPASPLPLQPSPELHLDHIFASKPLPVAVPSPPEDEDEEFQIIELQFLPSKDSSEKEEVLCDSDLEVECLEQQN